MSSDLQGAPQSDKYLNQALKWFQRATDSEPGDPILWFNRAWVEDELVLLRSAARSLGKAIELAPDFEFARYNLACTLSKMLTFEDVSEEVEKILNAAIESLEKIPKGSTLWLSVEKDNDLLPLRDSRASERVYELVRKRKPKDSKSA